MSYTPINANLFVAAYAGAIAGMGVSDRVPQDATIIDYAGLAVVAGAYAIALDQAWGLAPPNSFDLAAVETASAAAWQDRAPQATTANIAAATYAPLAAAVVAIVKSGDAYFTAQGIPLPPLTPAANAVIWRPASTSGGNHVSTWAEVMAAVAAADGAITIYVDDTGLVAPATPTIPVGVWNLRGASIVAYGPEGSSLPTGFGTQITVPDGAQLLDPGPLGIPCDDTPGNNLTFLCYATALGGVRPFGFVPATDFAGSRTSRLVLHNTAIYGDPSSSLGFFNVPAGVFLNITAEGLGNGYIEHDGLGIFMATIAATGGLNLFARRGFQVLGTNIASGNIGAFLTIRTDAETTPPTVVGFLGTLAMIKMASATNVGATDAAPLLGSTTVQGQLNALKPKAAVTPAALAIDWAVAGVAGGLYKKTIGVNSVFTFANQADGQIILVAITTTGAFTVTWPAGIKWPGGIVPTQTATGTDVYTFVDLGGVIYGTVAQAMA